jgi:hypothetical protein
MAQIQNRKYLRSDMIHVSLVCIATILAIHYANDTQVRSVSFFFWLVPNRAIHISYRVSLSSSRGLLVEYCSILALQHPLHQICHPTLYWKNIYIYKIKKSNELRQLWCRTLEIPKNIINMSRNIFTLDPTYYNIFYSDMTKSIMTILLHV